MSSDEQIRHSSKSYPDVGSRLLSEWRKTRTTDGITSIDAAIIEGDSVNRGKRGKNHPAPTRWVHNGVYRGEGENRSGKQKQRGRKRNPVIVPAAVVANND